MQLLQKGNNFNIHMYTHFPLTHKLNSQGGKEHRTYIKMKEGELDWKPLV